MITNFFSPLSFVAVFGSWIRDPRWVKIRIRDKHPGSATLLALKGFRIFWHRSIFESVLLFKNPTEEEFPPSPSRLRMNRGSGISR